MLFVLTYATCGQSQDTQYWGIKRMVFGTIVGGKAVTKQKMTEWPWLVAFLYKFDGGFFCSRSLISQKHVVAGEKAL